jgi:hypothetical protein
LISQSGVIKFAQDNSNTPALKKLIILFNPVLIFSAIGLSSPAAIIFLTR